MFKLKFFSSKNNLMDTRENNFLFLFFYLIVFLSTNIIFDWLSIK